MNMRITLLVLWTISMGCPRRDAPIAQAVPASRTLEFDQVAATRTDPPRLEADLTIPSGTTDWRLAVSCRSDGTPCRRASVSLSLRFARPTAPDVRIALRAEDEPVPSTPAETSECMEDHLDDAGPHRTCTIVVNDGWEADDLVARRAGRAVPVGGSSADEGRRRHFVARIENAGPPAEVHVEVSVIDPLE